MKLVLFLFFIFPGLLFSQYFFDFETDSLDTPAACLKVDWIQYPADRWSCSPEHPLSGSSSLQHTYDNPDPGCDYMVFSHDPVRSDSAFSCSFRVRHGYPPSSSNSWQVAMLATCTFDTLPEGGEQGSSGVPAGMISNLISLGQVGHPWISEGIVLGVNLTGSDDHLALWQWDQGNIVEICHTSLNYQEEVGVSASAWISLHMDADGKVSIYYSGERGSQGSQVGTGWLNSRPEGRQLVIRYRYSSAQDRKLWLDDIALEGSFLKDTLPPRVLSAEVVSGEEIKVIFTESPQHSGLHSFQLHWSNGGVHQPVSCQMDGEREVILRFTEEVPNREWMQMRVSGVCDRDGNCLIDTAISLRRNDAVWGDLVFNEVMADPDPPVSLPDREFVELYNRSGELLTLTGWQLAVNGRVYLLDSQQVEPGVHLFPGQYIVISGINLPNEGGELVMLNEHGVLVHAVKYAIPWNGTGWKREGGWSLESPDPDRFCGISTLWGYSVNPRGGTPGAVNSLNYSYIDTDPPLLLYTGFRYDQAVLSLYFSETVRSTSWIPSYFPIASGDMLPVQVSASFPFSDRIDLWLPGGKADKSEMRVTLPLLTDCSGNICRAREARGGIPGDPLYGSIMISEVMFAPREGAPEYIELHNPGPHYYDLMDLCVDVGEAAGIAEHPIPVSAHSRLMAPATYLVLTENVYHLMEAYALEAGGKWVGMTDWKALQNKGGFIFLTDRAGEIVDMVPYGEHLHLELMGDTRGVSLERIDFGTPGNDPDNWHSAASSAGYATPGEPNSQMAGVVIPETIIQVTPKVFSPDNDGFEDLLEVTVSPGGHGWAIHLFITDMEGRRIRVLANNDLSGPVSSYRWDGESDAGRMVLEGIYILHAWGYHDRSGKVWRKRVSVGVIYR